MSQDTHNTLVTVVQAASFGLFLWHDISELVEVINRTMRLDDSAEWKALMDELDALDPNTTQGLAWQGIKAYTNAYAKELANL